VKIPRRKSRASRQHPPADLDAAVARSEREGRSEEEEPPRIYNPDKGTRYHYRDPDQAAARPVCKASGAGWAEGDGGLKMCGLCPYIWAQRQASATEAAS
jgi:hypothetical protein